MDGTTATGTPSKELTSEVNRIIEQAQKLSPNPDTLRTETPSIVEDVDIKLEPGLWFVDREEKRSLNLLHCDVPILIEFPQMTPTSPIEIKREVSDSEGIVCTTETDSAFRTATGLRNESGIENGTRKSLRQKLQRQRQSKRSNEDVADGNFSDTDSRQSPLSSEPQLQRPWRTCKKNLLKSRAEEKVKAYSGETGREIVPNCTDYRSDGEGENNFSYNGNQKSLRQKLQRKKRHSQRNKTEDIASDSHSDYGADPKPSRPKTKNGNSYKQGSNLNTRKRIHTKNSPCMCEECGKCFTRLSGLARHKTIHSGDKPYKCDKCVQSFSRKSSLSRHIRLHTGERPYNCDMCENTFTRSDDLAKHHRSHTGEKSYTCDECGIYFARSDGLTKHMKTHHRP